MGLGLGIGATVNLMAVGNDAEAAVDALEKVIAEGFGEV